MAPPSHSHTHTYTHILTHKQWTGQNHTQQWLGHTHTHRIQENYVCTPLKGKDQRNMKMKYRNRERGKSLTKYEILLKSVYQHYIDYMSAIGQKNYGSWFLDNEQTHSHPHKHTHSHTLSHSHIDTHTTHTQTHNTHAHPQISTFYSHSLPVCFSPLQ